MEPVTLAAIGFGAQALGGIFGNIFSGADREAAEKLAQEALQEILALGAPPDLAREIFYQKFQQAGLYTPELEQAIEVGVSKVSEIQEDPALREAQINALSELERRGQTGLTAEDRVNYNQLRNKAVADKEAARQSIVQNMNARGVGGSGVELAAQLASSQGGVNDESAYADRVAADASARALQSIRDAASLGGDIRQQDFNVNNTRAAAEDAFRQFDVQNQIARQQRNVAERNRATQYNLSEKQRISDMNTNLYNSELLRQRNAEADNWNMKTNLAKLRADAKTNQANIKMGQASQTASTWGGVGAGIGQGISAINQANQLDEANKLKREELDLKYGVKPRGR